MGRGLLLLLLTCCLPGAAVAEPRWTMLRAGSMTVIGDQPEAALRDVATRIEQFRTVVGSLIPNAGHPPSLPTIVLVFGTRKAMQPFLPIANGRTAEVAGYFQRSGDVNHIVLSLEGFDESAAVVFHEYTHLLITSAVRSFPIWLNEGLAEYYSSYTLARDGRTAEIGRILDERLAAVRDRFLPFSDVLAVDSSAALHDGSYKRSLFYSEAWALTHYLLTQAPDGAAKINRYVAAVSGGRSSPAAFEDAFGLPAELEKQLKIYVHQQSFTATRYTFKDRIVVNVSGPARTLSSGEADAWLGDLQRRIGRTSEATARIESAASAQPDGAMAQLALGLLRIAQQRIDEGVAALDRARVLAPDDFAVQFLHGISLLKIDSGGSREYRDGAALSLTRAVALRPDSADAHAWLAYAEMLVADTLPAARDSIVKAIELSPGRLDFRLRYADVCVLEGKIDEARELLESIAAVNFDETAAAGAQARLGALAAHEQRRATRSVATPAVDPAATSIDPRIRLRLRPVQAGEERTYGLLTRVGCAVGEVRFEVNAGGRVVSAGAKRVEDVELIAYLADKDFTIACGPRSQPDHVYLTWRANPVSTGAADRIAVAVEFLPPGYVP